MENENPFIQGDIVEATTVYKGLGAMEVQYVDGEMVLCQYEGEKKKVEIIRIHYKNLKKVEEKEKG